MDFERLIGNVKNILLISIGLAYIAFGIFVIKEHWFLTVLEPNIAWILGTLLIVYGCYRTYRAIKIIKEES